MSLDFDDYGPTMVCVAHMSYTPCHHSKPDSPCQMTSEGAKVELVRKHRSAHGQ